MPADSNDIALDVADLAISPSRVVGVPFQKGRSGNPAGRPKVLAHVKELARGYTEEAVRALVQVMQSKKAAPAARVAAATAILDRGWGRPRQSVEVSGPEGGAIVLADLLALAAAQPIDIEE